VTRITRRPADELTPADRFLGALIFEAEIRRGATRQELIEVAIRHRWLDVVEFLTRPGQVSPARD
jgi:hypothetical protein